MFGYRLRGRSRSKFGNVKVEAFGFKFDSKKERDCYMELRSQLDKGEIKNLQRQVKYPFVINAVKIGTYIADFVYEDARGNEIVEDAKGFRTREYIIKKKLMLALYNIEVKEV